MELFFDIEVYPSWWCIVYKDNDYNVITSEDDDFVKKVKEMIHKKILIGFNIKRYDLRVLSDIIDGCDAYRIYEVSQAIIKNKYDHYNNYKYWHRFIFSDLYDDWRYGSLKEFESNIGMNIRESSIPFDRLELSEEDKKEIIEYCKYDVYAVERLFEYRKNYYETKKLIAKEYNINVVQALKSTNAKLAAVVLGAEKINRIDETTYKIPKKIEKYIRENVPSDIVNLFNYINETKKIVELFENKITYGVGGIHSTYSSNIYTETDDDDYSLILIDAGSFYPNMMINFNFLSRNVSEPQKFKQIVTNRMKRDKNDPRRDTDKLISNITYGAMKNRHNDLYDPSQASSLCYTGQLLITALSNKLYNSIMGLKVIRTNTDDIIVKVHKDSFDKMKEIIKEWESITGIKMEFVHIDRFYQRDVNSYIKMDNKGRIKVKGKWLNQAFGNGAANLNSPITHKAVVDYYLYDKPIEDTIKECNDILQFCFTTKTGRTYDKTYHYINNEPHNINKINRVVATTKKEYGTIRKYKKKTNRYDKIAEIPDNCYLMNNRLEMIDHLDREWYVNFAKNKIKKLKEV